MARILTKHKRRHLNFVNITFLIFLGSLSLFLLSSTLLRAHNVQVSVDIQNMKQDISILHRTNHLLDVELQALRSKDRVMAIALEAGLSSQQENIVIISNGE